MIKRLLIMMLAIVMLLSAMPLAALATETDSGEKAGEIEERFTGVPPTFHYRIEEFGADGDGHVQIEISSRTSFESVNAVVPADVDTVEELRQYVNDYLQESAETTYLYNTQDAIMKYLMEESTIADLSEAFVESYNHVFAENLDRYGAQYGLDGETYCQYFYGMTAADYISLYSEIQARQEVLLQTIANKENLNVSDEELETLLQERAAEFGVASVEDLLGNTTKGEYRNYFMSERVMEFLVENANIVEPAAE